jgi:hypothetical protein
MKLSIFFKIYRLFISPIFQTAFGIQCRYSESCSHYSERVLKEYGLFKGFFLSIKRIIMCNRFFN